jgi:hypothetical protein
MLFIVVPICTEHCECGVIVLEISPLICLCVWCVCTGCTEGINYNKPVNAIVIDSCAQVTSLQDSVGCVFANDFDTIVNTNRYNSVDINTQLSLERARAQTLTHSVHHLTIKHTSLSVLTESECVCLSARLPHLRVLDLSHNHIKQLGGVRAHTQSQQAPQQLLSLIHLTILTLKSNHLHTLDGLQLLTNLRSLDVSCNKLASVRTSVHYLVPLAHTLTHFDASFNPMCADTSRYVESVMSVLPHLCVFDGRQIEKIVYGYSKPSSTHTSAHTSTHTHQRTNTHGEPPPLPLETVDNWRTPDPHTHGHRHNQMAHPMSVRRRIAETHGQVVSGYSSIDSASVLYHADRHTHEQTTYAHTHGGGGSNAHTSQKGKVKMIRKAATPTQASSNNNGQPAFTFTQSHTQSQSQSHSQWQQPQQQLQLAGSHSQLPTDSFEAHIRRAYLRTKVRLYGHFMNIFECVCV